MENRDLIKKSVRLYSGYSMKFCEIFEALVSISEDYKVKASPSIILKEFGLKKATFYSALKQFKKDSLICNNPSNRQGILLNKDKIEDFLKKIK